MQWEWMILLLIPHPVRNSKIENKKSTKEKVAKMRYFLFFCINRKGLNQMQYQIKENCLTIFLPAEVDHHNAEEIKREADKVIEEQHIKYVIFDFGRTNFMDSSGIGVIMGRYRQIFLLGGEVWAIHTSERMRQILNMSGVTKIIQIYEEGMM